VGITALLYARFFVGTWRAQGVVCKPAELQIDLLFVEVESRRTHCAWLKLADG
jgi:hypothetical protein